MGIRDIAPNPIWVSGRFLGSNVLMGIRDIAPKPHLGIRAVLRVDNP
jgi:hypothetical protein